MKRTLQNRLLRTTFLGLMVASPAYAIAGDAQYFFPKDEAAKSSEKPKVDEKGKKETSSKSLSASNKTDGSVATAQAGKPKTNSGGFRPDFDGAGGRGPAMAPVEGKKNPDDEGYYVKTRGYRLEPEPDIPPYVRNLAKTYGEYKDIDWLNVGLDSRTRFEYRENDYRPWANTSGVPASGPSATPAYADPNNISERRYYPQSLWLVRTRGYLGIKDILDPFRFVVEFQDSRAFNNIYELQGQEINQTELIQGFGEIFLKDALGTDAKGQGRAISLRAGRMAFEIGSRRLIARNEFRNTTNNFEGFRLRLGERYNDVDLDSFLMRPVIRYPYQWDRPDWQNWVYGSFLSVRSISPYITLQPYFIGRHQYGDPLNPSNAFKVKRETQAPGLRVYGNYNNFDYDLDVMKQFGTVGQVQPYGFGVTAPSTNYPYGQLTGLYGPYGGIQKTVAHDAIAYGFDVGYTIAEHPWKPRISAVYIYGSGSRSPFGNVNGNVDTFYGFNQPFSRNDYIGWNNVKDPKIRIEFEPIKDTKIDSAFSAYWLASASERWDRANLWAPLGNRGTFMGTELDFRVRQKVNDFINISASYARFWPGSFTSSFAPPVQQQWPPTQLLGGSFGGGIDPIKGTGTTNGLTARPTNFFYLEATANAFGDGKPIAKLPGSDFMATWNGEQKPPKDPTWTDVYVGLNGGGAWSSPTITVQETPWTIPYHTTSNLNGPTQPLGNSNAAVESTLTRYPTRFTNKLSGFVGGLTMGVNWKVASKLVVGAEADLDGTAGNTNSKWTIGNGVWNSAPYRVFVPNENGTLPSTGTRVTNLFTTYSQHSATLNYLGTLRGRVGLLATPTLQVYGTGGLAYGGVIAANSDVTYRTNTTNASKNGTSFFYWGPQYSGTLVGWTAGGGLEWMFTPQWSVKADYLYYNLGSVSMGQNYWSVPYSPYIQESIAVNRLYNSGNGFGAIGSSSANFSGNVIRAGVNRHFDLVTSDPVTK